MINVKRIIAIILLFFITGCKSKLVCNMNLEEEKYSSHIKTVFEFKAKKIINAYTVNTLTFSTKSEAQTYFNMFDEIGDDYQVLKKNEKQIEIKTNVEYEMYNNNKELIKEKYEELKYFCE